MEDYMKDYNKQSNEAVQRAYYGEDNDIQNLNDLIEEGVPWWEYEENMLEVDPSTIRL